MSPAGWQVIVVGLLALAVWPAPAAGADNIANGPHNLAPAGPGNAPPTEQQICVTCHRSGGPGGNPHPSGFLSRHNLSEAATDGRCAICHR